MWQRSRGMDRAQGQRAPILVRGERGKKAGVAGMRPPRPCQPTMTKECLGLLLSDDDVVCMRIYVCVCVCESLLLLCLMLIGAAMCRPGPLCYFFVFFFCVSTSSGICIHATQQAFGSVLPGIRPLVRSARLIVLHLFLLSERLQFVLSRVAPEGI